MNRKQDPLSDEACAIVYDAKYVWVSYQAGWQECARRALIETDGLEARIKNDAEEIKRLRELVNLEREALDRGRMNEQAKDWVIWSEEHAAWWAPGRWGYTESLAAAGRYSREEALEICSKANRYCAAGSWKERALPDPLKS